ncbi:MAG: transglycosylase SLT domain-containing protein [Chlorobi bacterium]|nr:transglycosylase SLT domain-containing protein [Chlorobiota bacterium]
MEQISYDLGIPADWIMAVMYKESRLDHRAVNRFTGATGLIQFMPTTASGLGTSTQALRSMSNIAQLDYVKKYYWPLRYRVKSYTDAYLAVFFPAAMAKSENFVLRTSHLAADTLARQNKVIDYNHDHELTKAEVQRWALSGFTSGIQEILKKKEE